MGKRKKESKKKEYGRSKRQELQKRGVVFSKREMAAAVLTAATVCLLLGMGMGLTWGWLLAGTALCLLQVPQLYYNYKKSSYEKKRFHDVNAYLSHMARSFAVSGKVFGALRETRDVFPNGFCRQLLTKAVCRIERATDVELMEEEALQLMEEEYDCGRVRTLHDFMRKAESRGGSCSQEFRLLECMRQSWEAAALKQRKMLSMTRNMAAFEYAVLVLICMFMLRQFPEELDILHLPLVQGMNAFLIVCFFLVYGRLDKKLGSSMLAERQPMSEQQVKVYYRCIRKYQEKKSMLCYPAFLLARFRLSAEIQKAFPGWLFDVLLLIQSENVAVSMAKSIEKVPPVLKEELKRMKRELEEDPMSQEAYLSFLAELQVPQVENTMRYLYAVSTGVGSGQEMMELLVGINLNMLEESEKQKQKLKGDLLSVYCLVPTVPVMVCMMGYAAALIFVIFQNIVTML